MLLENKIAIVTGVANFRSIGWGIAQAFDREGATLVLTYLNDRFKKNVEELVPKLSRKPLLVECDVTKDDQIKKLFNTVDKEFGKLDVAVHCLAFAKTDMFATPVQEYNANDFTESVEISAYTLLPFAKYSIPLMEKAGGGSIMCLSYLGAEKITANYRMMSISKAALEVTARELANELGQRNIRVNTLSPGPMRTISAATIKGFTGMYEYAKKTAPLRRPVTIEEIGNTAVFFASDLSSAITGEVIHIDGGFHSVSHVLEEK